MAGKKRRVLIYAPPPRRLLSERSPCYDVLFLGIPKDRLPYLRELYAQFKGAGLRLKMQILDERLPLESAEGWELTHSFTPYIEYLHWVQQSRAILDIYQAGQTGYSLRVMEHLFFGKKLITGNTVIKGAEFYHPNNIFLLHEDDMDGLKAWLDLPFVPIAKEIREYYKFENWVDRFV